MIIRNSVNVANIITISQITVKLFVPLTIVILRVDRWKPGEEENHK